ncbi:MAG: methylamine utilization protein MauE [Deltaproteobacteria bacterium]|jgi:hypothetical protein|nr:methylamine utilization protein MauE [Deltaproteobacteria bacterium]MBW2383665.1 methylamine utilization protein MauE [Deltaproteobacteria bacterium]MBW2696752.1 methylamine utilization protein MauE [Deltaproteobacteria bacterium]
MDLLRDPAVQLLLHGFFAVLFARSAVHKWRDPAAFQAALDAYEMLPRGVTRGVSLGFAGVESALALGLLVPGMGPWPALVGAGLLILYTGAMAVAWLRGLREIDCGCGPPGAGRPIGPDLMLRNAVLAGALIAAAAPAAVRPLGFVDGVSALAAGFALVALQEAIESGLRQLRSMRAWRRPV